MPAVNPEKPVFSQNPFSAPFIGPPAQPFTDSLFSMSFGIFNNPRAIS